MAMTVAIYCYVRYSHIQKQEIRCIAEIDAPTVIDSTSIILNLNYTSEDLKFFSEKNQIQYFNKNDTPFIKYELFSYIRDRSYLHEDYYIGRGLDLKTECSTMVADDSWFFPRTPFLLNSNQQSSYLYPSNDTTKEKVIRRIISLSNNNYYFGRRYFKVIYDAEKHLDYEDYIKCLPEKDILSYVDDKVADSLSLKHELIEGVYKPWAFSSYDISKIYLEYHPFIDFYTTSIVIEFNGLIEVDNIFPEPDIITSHQIIYRDKEKISQLYRDNIQCLISLPQNETLQQVRIYIISAFITLFFTLLCKVIWDIVRKKYKERKKYNHFRLLLMKNGHHDIYMKFCNHRLLANTCICILLSMLFLVIAPKNIVLSPFFVIGVIGFYIPFYAHYNAISKGIINGLPLEYECKKYIHTPMYIYIIIVCLNTIFWIYRLYRNSTNAITALQSINYGIVFANTLVLILFCIVWYIVVENRYDSFLQSLKKGTLRQRNKKRFYQIAISSFAIFIICLLSIDSSITFKIFGLVCLFIYLYYLYRNSLLN